MAEADVMCYDDDASGPVVMSAVCPPEHEALLDCGDNDYFNTNPAAGNYLATHWNTANSSFLQNVTAPRRALLGLTGTADSPQVTITVTPTVSARLKASTITLGQTITVTGTVAPNHRGQRVYLQRLVNGSWKGATATLSNASSYTPQAKPPARGRLTHRVVKHADPRPHQRDQRDAEGDRSLRDGGPPR